MFKLFPLKDKSFLKWCSSCVAFIVSSPQQLQVMTLKHKRLWVEGDRCSDSEHLLGKAGRTTFPLCDQLLLFICFQMFGILVVSGSVSEELLNMLLSIPST